VALLRTATEYGMPLRVLDAVEEVQTHAVAEDIPLKLGPINADHRVCTVLIDAEYEMPKAGSAPNSSTDGLYLWCRTDTGTVSLLYAELTILDMNEAG